MHSTIYSKHYTSQVTIEQMDMRADAQSGYPGRGYRYYVGTPLFEAFRGLSYTTFQPSCTQQKVAKTLTLSCTVKNTGKLGGDFIWLLFHVPPQHGSHQQRPKRRLLDFDRVSVSALHTSEQTKFVVDITRQLALTSESGEPEIVAGVHVLEIQDGPKFSVTLP